LLNISVSVGNEWLDWASEVWYVGKFYHFAHYMQNNSLFKLFKREKI